MTGRRGDSIAEEGIDRGTPFWALLSGILLFLSFPRFGTGLLAWVALAPLLSVLKSESLFLNFRTGFIAGFSAYIGIVYWIVYVVVNYGYLPLPVGIVVMLLLAAYLALYVALFSAGVAYFKDRGIPRLLAAPLLWTSLEYAKSHLLTGFPWENLGYSQYLFHPFIQVADITGVYGLTFLIVLINVIICDALDLLRTKSNDRKKIRKIAAELGAGVLIVLAVAGYGWHRIDEVEKSLKTAPQLAVSLIQGNIDQNIKWRPAFQTATIGIYKTLTLEAAPPGKGLIVWPETAAPFFFQDYNDMHREVASLPVRTGNWMLFGSPSYQKNGDQIAFLNSAFLLAPDGRIAGQYDKVHLVPYGEYVPLRKFFPFINKLVEGIGDFRTGIGYEPVAMKGDGLSRNLGVMICYEGILPEAGRTYKRRGADLLVNITNDAWFGDTSAPYQHLSMTTFRAVETRLYLVRAANTGISAIIDPAGRILKRSPLFTEAALSGQVRFMTQKTFYAEYGDIFVYGCIFGIILIFTAAQRKRRFSNR